MPQWNITPQKMAEDIPVISRAVEGVLRDYII